MKTLEKEYLYPVETITVTDTNEISWYKKGEVYHVRLYWKPYEFYYYLCWDKGENFKRVIYIENDEMDSKYGKISKGED